ncbi:hypothetical protein K466DRAFT_584681 [Polyporus arcularius HHB13444]|uniref:Uncharacterized protein n=1 Tax=Polyporus arcularius HHB13444 TaxID=1314778 RepID=A0A5C3PJW6_9APHY|nr:hypothetical protein K466DRAFT_584681 [Polyporus arcularius HHB13444]
MGCEVSPHSSRRSSDAASQSHLASKADCASASDGFVQYYHLICGVVYTLLFSVAGCFVSVQVISGLSPRHALDADAALLACMVGSVALGLSTASVLSRLSPVSKRGASKAEEASSIHDPTLVVGSLLSSALAMAVGMAVVPGLATEAFGVRVALVRGVWGAAFVALCLFLKWIGWFDKPEPRVIPLQTGVRR